MCMSVLAQLRLLLWKNWLQQIRSPWFTLMEFFVPLLLIGSSFGLMIGLRKRYESKVNEIEYDPWFVMGNGYDMVIPIDTFDDGTAIIDFTQLYSPGTENQCDFLKLTKYNSTSFRIDIKLIYTPNTTTTYNIMKEVKRRYSIKNMLEYIPPFQYYYNLSALNLEMNMDVEPFETEKEMVSYATNSFSNQCGNPLLDLMLLFYSFCSSSMPIMLFTFHSPFPLLCSQRINGYKLYAQSKGLHWNQLFSSLYPSQQVTMGHCFIMLIVDALILMILTWYIEAVYPGGEGKVALQIAIMAHGQLQCCGSGMFLKAQYGLLFVIVKSGFRENGNYKKLRSRENGIGKISGISRFSGFETIPNKNFNIYIYVSCNLSLPHIPAGLLLMYTMCDIYQYKTISRVSDIAEVRFNSQHGEEAYELPELNPETIQNLKVIRRLTGFPYYWQHAKAMFIKRTIYFLRKWTIFLSQLLFPVFYLVGESQKLYYPFTNYWIVSNLISAYFNNFGYTTPPLAISISDSMILSKKLNRNIAITYTKSGTTVCILILCMVLYGWTSIPFTYWFSFMFTSAPKGFTLIVMYNIISG
uniref:ABC transporter domain-containing protein n=1 Tax=Heterorhabditis bacteriophora TaxID=37862 RepID=A0A1I7X1F1_HETBA